MPAALFTQVSSVSYECNLALEKIDFPENGLNKLYFSGNESLYVFEEWPTESRSEVSGNLVSFTRGDEEGMPIYTNLNSRQQVYKTHYHARKHPWILTEKIPEIDWEITQQQKKFGPLTAFLATGVYGGREYNVWFTPEIPIPLGPHRLNGLPGLILEAKSTDGMVSFIFSGYEPKDTSSIVIGPPLGGNKISRKLYDNYLIKKLLKTEANSPPEWNDTIDDPPVDYEIEKNKWKVFSKYKKNRRQKTGGW